MRRQGDIVGLFSMFMMIMSILPTTVVGDPEFTADRQHHDPYKNDRFLISG
jgi:hypothetical protein